MTLPRPFVIVEAVRILGLDVGSKTIGVAVSDELGLCAHVVKTLSRRGTRADTIHHLPRGCVSVITARREFKSPVTPP